MAIGTEVVARRYEDISADTPVSVDYPLFLPSDIYVYYGKEALVAALNTDYTLTLAEDFASFTFTPTASLITKIDALIAADATEENYVTVRRALTMTTEATPANAAVSVFSSREFERTVMRFQQMEEKLNRTLGLSPNFVGDEPKLQLNETGADRVLQFDSTGNAIKAGPTVTDVENAADNAVIAQLARIAAEAASALLTQGPTLLQIAATTIAAAVTTVYLSGHSVAGDRGIGSTLKRVASAPAHTLYTQDASGAYFVPADQELNPATWGLQIVGRDYEYDLAVPSQLAQRDADVTANNAVLAKVSSAAKALGLGVNCKFVGRYYHSDPYVLPDVTATGDAWDRKDPTFYRGMGRGMTISTYTGTDCNVKQATYDTSVRGQPMGPVVEGFTFQGPATFGNPACAIRMSNGRSTHILGNHAYGYPGGSFCVVKPEAKGGNFGMVLYNNLVGTEEYFFQNPPPVTYYPLETIERIGVRHFLKSEASVHLVGKFNDCTARKNRHLNPIVSFVDGRGIGDWTAKTATGSMANLNCVDNVVFFEGTQKIQEGELISATTTSARLRIDAFPANNDLTGHEFAIYNGKKRRWEYRYIDTYTESGVGPTLVREVTWTGGLPFTPITESDTAQAGGASTITLHAGANATDGYYNNHVLRIASGTGAGQERTVTAYDGTTKVATLNNPWVSGGSGTEPDATSVFEFIEDYRIAFADAEIRADFPAGVAQHHILWASIYIGLSDDYVEDAKRPMVVDARGRHLFHCDTSRWVVRSSNGIVHMDGSPARIRSHVGATPGGMDGVGAHLGTHWILNHDAEVYDKDHEGGGLILKYNSTGLQLENDNVVMGSAVRWNVIETVNHTNATTGHNVPYVVQNAEGLPWEPNTWGTVVAYGQSKVLVDGAAVNGSPLVMVSGNKATAITMRPSTTINQEIDTAFGLMTPGAPTPAELFAYLNAIRLLHKEVIENLEANEKSFATCLENKGAGTASVMCHVK